MNSRQRKNTVNAADRELVRTAEDEGIVYQMGGGCYRVGWATFTRGITKTAEAVREHRKENPPEADTP